MPSKSADKITSAPTLERVVRRAKTHGRTVVFTNGCFDLLHAGHVRLLEQAKRQGDLLIVGINSDASVRAIKGPRRPIVRQRDRAIVLAGLSSVDYVTIFPEPTPERLLARLRPHVLVKGTDWKLSEIVGREIVQQNHGRILRLPLLKGYSTTRLIERIKAA